MARKVSQQPYSNKEIGESLDSLHKLIDRCKVMYEQYFMGIQKIPPSQIHRDIERQIRELTQINIRNTGLRYRFATMTQKFGSYNTYWKRTMREIESGRYVRDIYRAGKRAAKKGEQIPEEMLAKLPKRMQDKIRKDRAKMAERMARQAERDGRPAPKGSTPGNVHQIDPDEADSLFGGDLKDLDLDAMFESITGVDEQAEAKAEVPPAKPAPPARKKAAPPPTPKPPPPRQRARPAAKPAANPPPPGLDQNQSRQLFDKYVKARQLVGERTDNVSYDKLMRSLNKQAPTIMKKHGAKGVDWKVVIKGDKVVLKAKPIKGGDGK